MSADGTDRQFAYEKLSVWQDARVLIRSVYALTRAFPKSEMFGLISQINRAAVSVACNLAEGSARMSAKDQAHFSQPAYSSLMESHASSRSVLTSPSFLLRRCPAFDSKSLSFPPASTNSAKPSSRERVEKVETAWPG